MAGVIKNFTATATGALPGIPAPRPWHKYGVQVKGVGGVPTSWSVTCEASLNGTDWTVLATHASGDGSTVFTTGKLAMWVRVNVVSLTLAPATALSIVVTASSDG